MKPVSIATKGWTRDKWLNVRKSSLGGSDAGTLLGYNPYSCKAKLWQEKVGLTETTDTTSVAKIRGMMLEEGCAQLWCAYEEDSDPRIAQEKTLTNYINGKKLRSCKKKNSILYHPQYSFVSGNIDRVGSTKSGKTIIECKTIENSVFNKIEGGLPPTYYAQLQWYLWIDGATHGEFSVLTNDRFFVYRFEQDKELIAQLEEEAKRFWDRVALAKKALELGRPVSEICREFEPPAEDTLAYEVFKKQTFKQGITAVDGEWEDYKLGLKYKNLNKEISELEKEKRGITNHFRELMSKSEAHTVDFHGGGKITYRQNTKGTPILNISVKEISNG